MRMWASLAMFKLSFGNKDQCKSQCNEKYEKTQKVVGIQKQLIDMMGKVLNETDNIMQGMPTSRSAFPNDLQKYKDVSELARDMMSTFMQIPMANRHIAKMMMKLIKHEKLINQPKPMKQFAHTSVAHSRLKITILYSILASQTTTV